MTDEIIRMAREAEISVREYYDETGSTPQELERFYELAYAAGAKAEREACAKVCDLLHWCWRIGEDNSGPKECAAAIRARGEK